MQKLYWIVYIYVHAIIWKNFNFIKQCICVIINNNILNNYRTTNVNKYIAHNMAKQSSEDDWNTTI